MENTFVYEPQQIEQEAAREAMGKVADIHTAPFYKHALLRFSSPDVVSLTRGHDFAVSQDDVDQSVDRLKGVFTAGIVSDNFAKRANISLSKNWKDPNNLHAASLSDIETPIGEAITIGLPSVYGKHEHVNLDNTYLLLVDDSITVSPDGATNYDEVLKKIRVNPRKLKGIVLIDSYFDLPDETREIFSTIPMYHAEQNAENVAALMQETFGQQSDRYFPVYGNSGALYWPEKMTYDELKEYLEERKAA